MATTPTGTTPALNRDITRRRAAQQPADAEAQPPDLPHARLLAVLRERIFALPEGYPWGEGPQRAPCLRTYYLTNWPRIVRKVENARRAAATLDEAHREIAAEVVHLRRRVKQLLAERSSSWGQQDHAAWQRRIAPHLRGTYQWDLTHWRRAAEDLETLPTPAELAELGTTS